MVSKSGVACSPPRYTLQTQTVVLQALSESAEVSEKVINLGSPEADKGIKSIEYQGGLYTITTLEGCSFTAQARYIGPRMPGMCPSFETLELSEGTCPKN